MAQRVKAILTRLLQGVLTVWAVITISFGLIRLMPGGPMAYLRAQLANSNPQMSMEEVNRMVETYLEVNPEKPILIAYVDYLTAVAQGNLGKSVWLGDPVVEIFASALPWTIFYSSITLLLSFSIAIIVGAVMAYRESTTFDYGTSLLAILSGSIPYYVSAILLVAVFGYMLGWFPVRGKVGNDVVAGWNLAFIGSAIHHAVMPIASFTFALWGTIALTMRGNAISVLESDYMYVGKLRGLTDWRLATRYVAKNAVLPIYTSLMISVGLVIGGSIVLETIFTYPGMGFYMFKGISSRDTPIMMGGFLLITIIVVLGILIADLTYVYIDPRAGSATEFRESYGSVTKFLRRTARNVVGRFQSTGQTKRTDGGFAEAPDRPERADIEMFQNRLSVDFGMYEQEHESTDLREALRKRVYVPLILAWEDYRTRAGLLICIGYILMGTLGPQLVAPPQIDQGPAFMQVFQSLEHPLGTDKEGRDLLSMTVYATPAMLKMLLSGAVFATIIATIVGISAGYLGGTTDRVLMTLTDIALTIPGLPLIMVLAATVEPSNPYIVGLLLTINAWAGLARSIRSEVLSVRDLEYVEVSRLLGVSTGKIMWSDLLPQLLPYVSINFVAIGRGVIFSSVALYFLGVLPFTNQNWGVMLNSAYQGGALLTPSYYYWLLVPMAVITTLTAGMILLTQGLDRVFNVRLRAKHESDEDAEAASYSAN